MTATGRKNGAIGFPDLVGAELPARPAAKSVPIVVVPSPHCHCIGCQTQHVNAYLARQATRAASWWEMAWPLALILFGMVMATSLIIVARGV